MQNHVTWRTCARVVVCCVPQMYRAAQAEFHELSMAWSENANVEPSEELLVVPDSATDGPGDTDDIGGTGEAAGSASSRDRAMAQSAERRRTGMKQ